MYPSSPNRGGPPDLEKPSVERLEPELRSTARAIATRLSEAGHQAWLVGGCVRDLALGNAATDLDFCTDARPEQLEELFERTFAVGKAFGTIVVAWPERRGAEPRGSTGVEGMVQVEITTFREDREYSDGRRPDAVSYSTSAAIDALRRDFTCNALYLDPLTDQLLDPENGWADLDAGVLRAIGEAQARFHEDGLRLLRMARFEARYGLRAAPGLHEAARAARGLLPGLSAERVLGELEKAFAGPAPAHFLAVLEECDLWEPALSRFTAAEAPEARRTRIAAVAALGPGPGTALGLAALLRQTPEPAGSGHGNASEGLEQLRVSKALRLEVLELIAGAQHLDQSTPGEGPRADDIRVLRRGTWPETLRLARAWSVARGQAPTRAEELETWRRAAGPQELQPEALLRSTDLDQLEVPRGPAWGRLLQRAEDEQLEGRVHTREQALAWLRAQLAEGGGEASELS